jgi:hypothetical protein
VPLEFAFEAAPFVRPDQALMAVADGMQRAIEAEHIKGFRAGNSFIERA